MWLHILFASGSACFNVLVTNVYLSVRNLSLKLSTIDIGCRSGWQQLHYISISVSWFIEYFYVYLYMDTCPPKL